MSALIRSEDYQTNDGGSLEETISMKDYQFIYCLTCGATHSKNYEHEKSSFIAFVGAFVGMFMCIVIIGLIWAALFLIS